MSERDVIRVVVAFLLLMLAAGTAAPARAEGTPLAKAIFTQRCTACHTYGKGTKIGPDLRGIGGRRPRAWLLKFIRSSQGMVRVGDAIAKRLFEQFKQQKMPDWTDLSEEQVGTVVDWLAAGGPEQKGADERGAEQATEAEIAWARGLFRGTAKLSNGGLSCSTCHSIADSGDTRGGTLGPSLTDAYSKYRDRALTLFLRRPCFRRLPDSSADLYLTPEESFALKAYLRSVGLSTASKAKGESP
jgi:cytochrome c2